MTEILAAGPRNVNLLTDEAAAEFGPFLSDADRRAEAEIQAERDILDVVAASWADHLEAEAEDARWDAMAEDAATEAAWDLACELGHLPC